MRYARVWSIRGLLLAMIAIAMLPPISIGLWQIRSAARVGRSLLASQLDRELGEIAVGVRTRWTYREGALLLLAGNDVSRAVLRTPTPTNEDANFLRAMASGLDGVDDAVLVRTDQTRAVLVAGDADRPSDQSSRRSGVVFVAIPVSEEHGRLGELRASISLSQLLPARASLSPPYLAVFDSSGGRPLIAPLIPAELFHAESFEWNRASWLVRRRLIDHPSLVLALAAPLDPFVAPFQQAATERTAGLILGSVVALALAGLLASRLTQSVKRLSIAADDIAHGNFEKRIVGNGTTEIAGLARSFNAMTATLEATLGRLSERASLAAVGEFAASLAHEIRNPLTAVRVDLQYLTRHANPGVAEQPALDRALRQVDRLDRTVSAALELARGTQVHLTATAIGPVVRDAVAAAAPEAVKRHVQLVVDAPDDDLGILVLADAAAVHQMVLNLLLNAVQAIDGDGGVVRVAVAIARDRLVITVEDNGRGISPEQLPRVFDPFYTTKAGGNGLGLAVARRIAVSHGSEITIHSDGARGTIATVTLPLATLGAAESMPDRH